MRKSLFTLAILVSIFALIGTASAGNWRVPGDFATIQEALDSPDVAAGDRILVASGEHAGATVNKAVEIRGQGRAVITSGPLELRPGQYVGFYFDYSGAGSSARIRNLEFDVAFPVFSRGADNVIVEHCSMTDPIQGVSAWSGDGWIISHNEINGLRTMNGGGIGILLGSRAGDTADNSLVSYNRIRGTLSVWSEDGGGYNGSGVVLYADFRWGGLGASQITGNRVTHNTIGLVSDDPEVVDVVALELTDTSGASDIICDNAIGFNDFRGTALQIALTPEELGDCNDISRNLGDNRGHGAHPGPFH